MDQVLQEVRGEGAAEADDIAAAIALSLTPSSLQKSNNCDPELWSALHVLAGATDQVLQEVQGEGAAEADDIAAAIALSLAPR